MKAILSLEQRTILPNIKFRYPNPASMFLFSSFAYFMLIERAEEEKLMLITIHSPLGSG
jgi:hypothetical protein